MQGVSVGLEMIEAQHEFRPRFWAMKAAEADEDSKRSHNTTGG